MSDYYVDGNGMTQAWPDDVPPFLDFPDVGGGIADYSNAGSPCGGLVTFASDDGSTSTSILNCIPEPGFHSMDVRDDWDLLAIASLKKRLGPGSLTQNRVARAVEQRSPAPADTWQSALSLPANGFVGQAGPVPHDPCESEKSLAAREVWTPGAFGRYASGESYRLHRNTRWRNRP